MNTREITNIYAGSTQGSRMYLGDELVWPIGVHPDTGDTPTPDTGDTGYTPVTSITVNVPGVITDSGQAIAVVNPGQADANIVWSTSDPNTATIDQDGNITVIADGQVTICARDTLSGLQDCETITVVKTPEPGPDTGGTGYTNEYFTIEALESGNLYMHASYVYYSVNGGPWLGYEEPPLWVNAGDKVRFKHDCVYNAAQIHGAFSGNTLAFNVYGNILSMQYLDSFSGETSAYEYGDFQQFFLNCTGLVDASNLVIPTGLTTGAFSEMFKGCTSLLNAPELPATTLTNSCYGGMFEGCRRLTLPPVLPATTLQPGCYNRMFYGCSTLREVTCYATANLSTNNTYYWLIGTPTGSVFKCPQEAISYWSANRNGNGVPSNWSIQALP